MVVLLQSCGAPHTGKKYVMDFGHAAASAVRPLISRRLLMPHSLMCGFKAVQ